MVLHNTLEFKVLAVLVLPFTDRSPRAWKVPGNICLARWELSIGLGLITALLSRLVLISQTGVIRLKSTTHKKLRQNLPRSSRTLSVPKSSSYATTTWRELRRKTSLPWTSLPQATRLWHVCPAALHVFRTIPIFCASMAQKARATCAIVL